MITISKLNNDRSGVKELVKDVLKNEYEITLDGETVYLHLSYLETENTVIIHEIPEGAAEEFYKRFDGITNNYCIKYEVA